MKIKNRKLCAVIRAKTTAHENRKIEKRERLEHLGLVSGQLSPTTATAHENQKFGKHARWQFLSRNGAIEPIEP